MLSEATGRADLIAARSGRRDTQENSDFDIHGKDIFWRDRRICFAET